MGAHVILTDKFGRGTDLCLENVVKNNLEVAEEAAESRVAIRTLRWASSQDWLALPENLDFILASDCFYDCQDFDQILACVSFLMQVKGAPGGECSFITTYQERNSDWNIKCLMDRWNLRCEYVPLEDFEASSPHLLGSKLPGNHTIHMIRMFPKTRDT